MTTQEYVTNLRQTIELLNSPEFSSAAFNAARASAQRDLQSLQEKLAARTQALLQAKSA